MILSLSETTWKRQADGSYREASGRFELCPKLKMQTGRAGSGNALGGTYRVVGWELVDLSLPAPNPSWNGRPFMSYSTLREAKAAAEKRLS